MFQILFTKAASETYSSNICSEDGTFLEIAHLFDDVQNNLPGKFGICSVTKKCSWKIIICSVVHLDKQLDNKANKMTRTSEPLF